MVTMDQKDQKDQKVRSDLKVLKVLKDLLVTHHKDHRVLVALLLRVTEVVVDLRDYLMLDQKVLRAQQLKVQVVLVVHKVH